MCTEFELRKDEGGGVKGQNFTAIIFIFWKRPYIIWDVLLYDFF